MKDIESVCGKYKHNNEVIFVSYIRKVDNSYDVEGNCFLWKIYLLISINILTLVVRKKEELGRVQSIHSFHGKFEEGLFRAYNIMDRETCEERCDVC